MIHELLYSLFGFVFFAITLCQKKTTKRSTLSGKTLHFHFFRVTT